MQTRKPIDRLLYYYFVVAVFSTVSNAVRKLLGHPEIHVEVTNSISLNDLEANVKNAVPEADHEVLLL